MPKLRKKVKASLYTATLTLISQCLHHASVDTFTHACTHTQARARTHTHTHTHNHMSNL